MERLVRIRFGVPEEVEESEGCRDGWMNGVLNSLLTDWGKVGFVMHMALSIKANCGYSDTFLTGLNCSKT